MILNFSCEFNCKTRFPIYSWPDSFTTTWLKSQCLMRRRNLKGEREPLCSYLMVCAVRNCILNTPQWLKPLWKCERADWQCESELRDFTIKAVSLLIQSTAPGALWAGSVWTGRFNQSFLSHVPNTVSYIAYNTECVRLQAGQDNPLTHNGWGQSLYKQKQCIKPFFNGWGFWGG